MLSLSNLSIDFLKSNDYAIAAFIPFLKLCSSHKVIGHIVLSQIDEFEKEELEYKTVEEDQELV